MISGGTVPHNNLFYFRDGKVSFSDFVSTVYKEPLMLEAFGSCLPSSRTENSFLRKILDYDSKNLQE